MWPWNVADDPWKTIGHLFYAASSFVHHFKAISEFNLELQSGNAQFGSKSAIFVPCDLEIWGMTLKNNRAPLLSITELCASFYRHMWIETGVTVRQLLNWILTSVTLTFDLGPWPFAWTSLLSLVITPENFMMIRWWEHSQLDRTRRKASEICLRPPRHLLSHILQIMPRNPKYDQFQGKGHHNKRKIHRVWPKCLETPNLNRFIKSK